MFRSRPAELTQLADGVFHLRRWIFNCYLFAPEGADTAVIVDIGLPSYGPLAAAWIDHHDRPSAVVVPTHMHSDHIAGWPSLLAARGATDLCVSPMADRYAAGEVPRAPGPRDVAKIMPVFFDQRVDLRAYAEIFDRSLPGYGGRPFVAPEGLELATRLHDGDGLPGLDGWTVIEVPGHADDSLALYNAERRILCSGDAVLSARGQAWFSPEVVDPVKQAATEERLRKLDVELLLPGHGRPVSGPDVMGRAVGFMERPRKDLATAGSA